MSFIRHQSHPIASSRSRERAVSGSGPEEVSPAKACRTGRGLLGWTVERLAEESGVEVSSVYVLERLGAATPADTETILAAIDRACREWARPSDTRLVVNLLHSRRAKAIAHGEGTPGS